MSKDFLQGILNKIPDGAPVSDAIEFLHSLVLFHEDALSLIKTSDLRQLRHRIEDLRASPENFSLSVESIDGISQSSQKASSEIIPVLESSFATSMQLIPIIQNVIKETRPFTATEKQLFAHALKATQESYTVLELFIAEEGHAHDQTNEILMWNEDSWSEVKTAFEQFNGVGHSR